MADHATPDLTPIVLHPIGLVAFIQYILDQHAPPSTIVVCSSKEDFLSQLCAATAGKTTDQANDNGNTDPHEQTDTASDPKPVKPASWATPTLRLLASSRTIKLVFCPEVTHLRAYMATHAHRLAKADDGESASAKPTIGVPMLAILNAIEAHRPTSAFSAQGLNRTWAGAVEAAHSAGSRLTLAECHEDKRMSESADAVTGEATEAGVASTVDPWEEEVSMLNITTKTFGAGDRGWVGRTVKIRTIAERWCRFESLSGEELR